MLLFRGRLSQPAGSAISCLHSCPEAAGQHARSVWQGLMPSWDNRCGMYEHCQLWACQQQSLLQIFMLVQEKMSISSLALHKSELARDAATSSHCLRAGHTVHAAF